MALEAILGQQRGSTIWNDRLRYGRVFADKRCGIFITFDTFRAKRKYALEWLSRFGSLFDGVAFDDLERVFDSIDESMNQRVEGSQDPLPQREDDGEMNQQNLNGPSTCDEESGISASPVLQQCPPSEPEMESVQSWNEIEGML